MKPSPAGTAKELEPPAPARGEQRTAEPEGRWREKGEADTERQRTRERQEATLAGLAELEYLRQRQELLVRGALRGAGGAGAAAPRAGELLGEAAQRSRLEEKFLEENILLLRKQLNCLRRRDAGLLNQLQELDKQISDLRLDVEKTSEEHLETDSRPSSGFYELSDGASGSLSNSSNSVFSECLSSCHSSTCFCSPLEATLTLSDGCPKSAGEFLALIEILIGRHQGPLKGYLAPAPFTGGKMKTVVDTSEDEQSNYTTNCFGDSESSVSEGEFVGESTTTSDSEESGGLIWSQFVQTLPIQTVTAPDLHNHPAKTFVKIKASHNLKKKILRFRSGSLKLMTTV
ncbi:LOW QUALITY PROTEIN: dapper homolog 1 [Hylobates moloch]|uniref:LOW QUALITY PROTEIN: dapper homolog 1 n=1 Tax=Hylobates moloch TaxID=81572 RepID=UPI0013635514|nr:LOW QUALITY PROTEIN: dapper homolog 1 [Hylobates moloch]